MDSILSDRDIFFMTKYGSALFVFILIISGNYIGQLLPCRVQSFLTKNMMFKHLLGFMTLLFFVALTMPYVFKRNQILTVFGLYLFFIIFSKTYYVFWIINVIIFACIYLIGSYFESKTDEWKKDNKEIEELFKIIKRVLVYFTIVTVSIGFLIYLGNKKREYKNSFTYFKFFFGKPDCSAKSPPIVSYIKEINYAITK
jgi:hypothetical protein